MTTSKPYTQPGEKGTDANQTSEDELPEQGGNPMSNTTDTNQVERIETDE